MMILVMGLVLVIVLQAIWIVRAWRNWRVQQVKLRALDHEAYSYYVQMRMARADYARLTGLLKRTVEERNRERHAGVLRTRECPSPRTNPNGRICVGPLPEGEGTAAQASQNEVC